jgi:hypothetical protein
MFVLVIAVIGRWSILLKIIAFSDCCEDWWYFSITFVKKYKYLIREDCWWYFYITFVKIYKYLIRSIFEECHFSGMWCHVWLVRTNTSEERIAAIVRVMLFFSWIFLSWKWRRHIPMKPQPLQEYTHGATSQKIAFFIVTTLKTSNPT